jgi:hypothetical protein
VRIVIRVCDALLDALNMHLEPWSHECPGNWTGWHVCMLISCSIRTLGNLAGKHTKKTHMDTSSKQFSPHHSSVMLISLYWLWVVWIKISPSTHDTIIVTIWTNCNSQTNFLFSWAL